MPRRMNKSATQSKQKEERVATPNQPPASERTPAIEPPLITRNCQGSYPRRRARVLFHARAHKNPAREKHSARMKNRLDLLTTIGTWAGSIGVVISLLLVRVQILDLRTAIQGQTYQNVSQIMLDIDHLFIDRPELRPYFYGNKSVEGNDIDKERITSVAETIMDSFDSIYHQRETMPPQTYLAWLGYMRDIYGSSPALRDLLSRHRDWYGPDLVQSVESPDN